MLLLFTTKRRQDVYIDRSRTCDSFMHPAWTSAPILRSSQTFLHVGPPRPGASPVLRGRRFSALLRTRRGSVLDQAKNISMCSRSIPRKHSHHRRKRVAARAAGRRCGALAELMMLRAFTRVSRRMIGWGDQERVVSSKGTKGKLPYLSQ